MGSSNSNKESERVYTLVESAIANKTLSKLIMSRSRDSAVIRSVATIFQKSDEIYVAFESYMKDGKAIRKNFPASGSALFDTVRFLVDSALSGYRQVNIICAELTCEVLISDKGKLHLAEKKQNLREITVPNHDKVKKYLLTEGVKHEFLVKLGVSDSSGRVYDKKQAKFRQINRFLDHIDAVYKELPESGELCVCDLCCGKSYLTFAAYWYFSVYKQRDVSFYGVDLKADVISYCDGVAKELGWEKMHFSVGNVSEFVAPKAPDMVISLHACDIATDHVLAGAICSGAKVILSTPCCHHELNRQLNCPELDIICKHSMLKQKLADAATDALRAQMLECFGYRVNVCELIDPEETPKNLLIRAVKRGENISKAERNKLLSEYNSACELLGATPKLRELLSAKGMI